MASTEMLVRFTLDKEQLRLYESSLEDQRRKVPALGNTTHVKRQCWQCGDVIEGAKCWRHGGVRRP